MQHPLGFLMVDIAGFALTDSDRDVLLHPACGGVILFGRNIESFEQVKQLVASIHALRDPPLLVAVDQEGGPVQRIKAPLTLLPAMSAFGDLYDDNAHQALESSRAIGWLMASELLTLGLDFSFAPVVDVNLVNSPLIQKRAFHQNAQTVSKLARAFCSGVHAAGMQSVAKHFPGHGGVLLDSHVALPRDLREFEALWIHDLEPYRGLIQNNLAGVMTAHVIFEKIDPELVTFSAYWIRSILRERLGFKGLVVSDDLSMTGAVHIASDPLDRLKRSRLAGCEFILLCNDRGAVERVMGDIHDRPQDWPPLLPETQQRLQAFYPAQQLPSDLSLEALQKSPQWHQARMFVDQLS